MRKYKIGITFNFESKTPDIWANGAAQNIVFLYKLFSQSDIVDKLYLVSWGPENRKEPPEGFKLKNLDINYALIDDVIDELDVLIEGTLIIEPHQVRKIHEHNGKVITYKIGNEYIMDVESTIFKEDGRAFNGVHFDSVWTLPHHENMCRSYLSIMYRSDVHIVPYIWDSMFCDEVIKRLKENTDLHFGYTCRDETSKRISSFEPNINVVKTSFIPILICEQAYRTDPEKIKHFYTCNTWNLRDHPTFHNFIGRTTIVSKSIMSIESRFQMPDFLARYTDIVLSHQWENGLNNAYFDALYGGYPLIHNSKFLPKGVGYYYDQFDAFDGAKVLLDVIDNHDKNHNDYVKRANEYLDSLSPVNPVNIYLYEKEIKRLFE